MTRTEQFARQYRDRGWSVIPIPIGSKIPTIKWKEYQTRFATDDELHEWFGDNQANIAILTGSISNLEVLDADGEEGLKQVLELGLVSPFTVTTGQGLQLYFRYGGGINTWNSKDHQGLDSRGEGGYVIAPPSIHPTGKPYRWTHGVLPPVDRLPEWPTICKKAAAQILQSSSKESELLSAAIPGERHKKLVQLACYFLPRVKFENAKTILLQWNTKNLPPLPETEVVKQLADINRRFESGRYTSSFKIDTIEQKDNQNEIEISSPADDMDSYITESTGSTHSVPELPTGFASIDDATFGLHRGTIFTIGARPGTGKTSLCIKIAIQLCQLNKRVLLFSTEFSKTEVYNAIFAIQGVNAYRLTNRLLTVADRGQLNGLSAAVKGYPVHIVKASSPSIAEVREAVERIKPDVIIFDHIQHISTGEKEYTDLSRFTRTLKDIATNYNCAVVVASQLHRGAALEGVLPELHHLKGCGTIEEESSVVLLMHDDVHKGDRPVLIRVAKNRHGKCGETTLMFHAETTNFEDMNVAVA